MALNAGLPHGFLETHRLLLRRMTLEDAERLLIRKALERYGGNVSDAAKALGLSRSALYRRLEKYGL